MEENTTPNDYEFNALSYSSASDIFGFDIFSEYTLENLHDLITDPMSNRDTLRKLCETIYNSNGVVTNVIDYMTSLPTLDHIIISYSDTPSTKKRGKKIASDFLKTIRHKEVVRDALRSAFIGGDYYGYCDFGDRPLNPKTSLNDFETKSIAEINEGIGKVSVITLPAKYCKIIGYKNSVPIVAMNLEYFRSEGSEPTDEKIRKYPKEIREALQKYIAGKSDPWLKLNTDNTIAIKYRSSRIEPFGRPLPLAALTNVLYQDEFVKTKRGILNDFRSRVYFETFPEGDKKGISSLNQKQQEAQHNAVRDALQQKGARNSVSFFSVAAGTKLDSVKTDGLDILDEKYESNLRNDIASDMGFAGALLSGAGENASYSSMEMNARLISSQVFQVIEMIVEELNKCLNANLIRSVSDSVEICYLPITYINRTEMSKMAREMYLEGRGSLLFWAATMGLKPEAFLSLAMEEKDLDLDNLLPVHPTSYTQTDNGSGESGRPSVENPTNTSTVQTRARNSNKQPKPSKA